MSDLCRVPHNPFVDFLQTLKTVLETVSGAVFVCYHLVMAKSQAERNTVGNWSINNDPSFDDHLGRVVRRKMQKSEALNRIRIISPRVKVWKIYGEWCVVTRAGEIVITSSDWLTAWKWAQRMYGRPF